MTYIWADNRWHYLAVVLDLYRRRVIGWALSTSPDAQLAVKALDYVVRVSYDAQNGFGATLRDCAIVAYFMEDGQIKWNTLYAVQQMEDGTMCNQAVPVSMLAEFGDAFATLNFENY